ncbi:hypothetical protein FO519_007334 [Halicephalobus sp. NKZ332]|nr:hypothetical protein FO519_007334 [Halicephalobus sp. NKZ332]
MTFGSGSEVSRNPPGLRCLVCDEIDAAKHYGSVCCSGCKGFFRRTVRFHKVYDCPFGKQCSIKKEFRNCCRACRFNKCLKVGLNPLLVHGDRGVTNPEISGKLKASRKFAFPELPISPDIENPNATTSFNPLKPKIKKELQEESDEIQILAVPGRSFTTVTLDLPLGRLNFVTSSGSDPSSIWEYFGNVEKFIDEFADSADFGHLTEGFPIELNLSAKECIQKPRMICQRTKMDWAPNFFMKASHIKGAWARSVQAFFDWISFIPEFEELSDTDRELLTRGRGMSSVWMLFTHRSAVTQAPGLVFTGGCYFPRDKRLWDQIEVEAQLAGKKLSDLANNEIIDEMRNLNISTTECALLKLLSLFMTVPQLSPEGVTIVQRARRKYTNVLNEFVRMNYPQLDASGILERISRLMLLLPPIERVSQLDDDTMGMMAVFNMANMKGSLTYEMHIQKNEGIKSDSGSQKDSQFTVL